jgi:hypothetical protein
VASSSYLTLPGVAGQYASAADSVALSITSDVDIRAYVAPDDWTPTSVQSLVSKWEITGNLRSYALDLDTTGKLAFISSSGGTSGTSANTLSSAATGFTDGTGHWVRATWRNSDNRVQFFTSNDASSVTSPTWTQLGTDQSWSSTGIFDSTAKLEVGSRNTGTAQPLAGKVYRAQVRSNVADDGTGIQLDADFTTVTVTTSRAPTTFTEGSSNAATVTINGTAAWSWLSGSPNSLVLPGVSGQYASTPDAVPLQLTSDLTIDCRFAADTWVPAVTGYLVSKGTAGASGGVYSLGLDTAGKLRFVSSDGVTAPVMTSSVATGLSAAATKWVRASFQINDGAAHSIVRFYMSDDGSTWTQLGSDVQHAGVLTIQNGASAVGLGALSNGTSPLAGKMMRARVFGSDLRTGSGTSVFDADFTGVTITTPRAPTTFTESSTNAATVTMNGSAAWQWQMTVTAAAEAATGTGAASNASPSLKPNADNAAGTGTAYDDASSLKPNAGNAAGTGTAGAPSPALAVNASNASGTGAAADASASVSTSATTANAEAASGTGSSYNASPALAPNASNASGTGSAGTPSASFGATCGAASGTGAASGASPSLAPNAGNASGMGEGFDLNSALAANIEAATGTGSAYGPYASFALVSGLASGSGAALSPSLSLAPNADNAAGTGSSYNPAGSVPATAGTATATTSEFAVAAVTTTAAGIASATVAPAATGTVTTAATGIASATVASPALATVSHSEG